MRGRCVFTSGFLVACQHGVATPQQPSVDAGDPVTIDAAPVQPRTCGLRSGMRGATHRTVHVAGLDRTYVVYLPAQVDPATPIPLVIVAHGYTMSGQAMFDITQYPALADREHLAVAFPDGQGGPNTLVAPWNVGANVCTSYDGPPPSATGDDFAFLDAIKADVAADQCVDARHVFMTGFSMGGYFSNQVGCMRDDFAAVAPHSGGTHDLATCTVARKPIILFHGDADAVVPQGCTDPEGASVLGTSMAAADAWALHNGCSTSRRTRAVTNGTCDDYLACPADGQVTVCRFANMGHCWAGGASTAGVFSCPDYAQATQLEWQFFKDHAW